ncbi:MAG: pyridoxal phosphate-dependent aminotransferase [Candidatus Saccharibacteria bacterium]|nr:pyridoxal phosphate-dependent aminotransferase [Candidatus Saccharibacteria bacterium]
MRVNIVHPGAGELRYEIRSIVKFAKQLQSTGVGITWENIGDPVAKGEEVPQWIRDIVSRKVQDSSSFGYSPTKGLDEAREYLARARSQETGNELLAENIIFFNGLGDAIGKVYTWLNPIARVLGPNPAYPTHSSIEGAHGRSEHLTYELDPDNGWLPDMEDIRNKVKYNPNIAALLLINPDNPTGVVYPREILEEFVAIAEEFDLFLIADEIYAHLSYAAEPFTAIASVAHEVPIIVMRGLSKEVPWPGSRCGWLEFYNVHKDKAFETYVESIEEAKMTEVCSTTLPQAALPDILSDERYQPHLAARREKYKKRAGQLREAFKDNEAIKVIEPKGAFYAALELKDLKTRDVQAANPEAQELLDDILKTVPTEAHDKRFCYQLLAATGICVVPLSSGFNSSTQGFRMTLLEEDDHVFEQTLHRIAEFTAKNS